MRLDIKEWNKIQDKFVESFGWDNGLRFMTSEAREVLKFRSPYELDTHEDHKLVKRLRSRYNEEIKYITKKDKEA